MIPNAPTAAIYARVSTQDQNHAMQLTEVRAFAARMGWNVVEYTEKMSSVKKRPVLDQLMRDAQLRQFDIVVVWKLDRFARSLKQLMDNITLLDSYGVRFLSMTQGIDTDKQNAAGRLMMQIFGAFAEFERSMIVDRVRSGMAEAKREGKHLGRPVEIWRRDEALELRGQGYSFRQIAAKLDQPESSIRRALKPRPV
jgi:DNA invertase Pin-like site-specific DNA recombinase